MSIICKNCSTEFQGKFCPICGQRSKTGRITIKQVIKDIRDQFVHFDRGFLYTIKELATRPGDTLREYIEGKRVQHVKPLKFLFWATAISIFFSSMMDMENRIISKIESENGAQLTEAKKAMGHTMMQWFSKHPGLVALMTVPTIALAAWLFFRKRGYNYAEMFTVNTYLMGFLSLFGVAMSLLIIAVSNFSAMAIALLGLVQWLVWCVYFGWTYSGFVQKPRSAGMWLRGVGTILIGYTFLILIISLVSSTLIYFFHDSLAQWFGQATN